eukprot:3443821-Amphidinium_carterae.1
MLTMIYLPENWGPRLVLCCEHIHFKQERAAKRRKLPVNELEKAFGCFQCRQFPRFDSWLAFSAHLPVREQRPLPTLALAHVEYFCTDHEVANVAERLFAGPEPEARRAS